MKFNFNFKFIFIFLFLLISINPSKSNEKTAFVDIDYIIKNSNIGKKILNNINDLDNKNIIDLKKKNKILKDLELAIKNKKKIISEEAFNKEVVLFRQKVEKFKNEKNKKVKEFNNFKKKEIEKVFKQISPIISDYMEQNSVNILLDSKNIFMGKTESNLTDEVLREINKIIN